MAKKKLTVVGAKPNRIIPGFFFIVLVGYSYYSTRVMTERVEALEKVMEMNNKNADFSQRNKVGNSNSQSSVNSIVSVATVNKKQEELFENITGTETKALKIDYNTPLCAFDKDQIQILTFNNTRAAYYDKRLPKDPLTFKWDPKKITAKGKYKLSGMVIYINLLFDDGNTMYLPANVLTFSSDLKVINSLNIMGEVFTSQSCKSVNLSF